MRVLIADDERPARDEMAYLLRRLEGIEVVGEAASGEEVLRMTRQLHPDVLFLDIQMPDASGVEIARQLMREGLNPVIVFATAFDQYAVDAFDVNAVDYLLKPIHEERLEETILRLKKRLKENQENEENTKMKTSERLAAKDPQNQALDMNRAENIRFGPQESSQNFLQKLDQIFQALNPSPHKLKIEENGKIYLIPASEILYATIEDRSVRIVTRSKSYLTNYTLSELEEILGSSFLRVHKSYLANMDQIESIVPWFNNTYNLIMKDQQEIPVSRTYVKLFRQRLNL